MDVYAHRLSSAQLKECWLHFSKSALFQRRARM